MMVERNSSIEYSRALEDFREARKKARLQYLWASVTGQSKELLPYDDISNKLYTTGLSSKGIDEIPIDAIIGSVNRYRDFDRNFLPLRDEDMERWARVKSIITSPGSPGLPPIRVYKLGDAYFVLDGNHRVSISKEMGIETIQAYVTEIQTNVPLSPDDSPEEIILKAEYSSFLKETKFDKAVPGVELKLTFPGQYETLKEHIRVHRHYMGIEQFREIPIEEAVRHWYENVYKPVVKVIRAQDILKEFSDRTETDLYIWVLDHQSYLEERLGWSIKADKAASDLVNKRGKRFARVIQRASRKFFSLLLPRQLEDFTSPGEWHKKKKLDEQSLFSDILVAMNGTAESWLALEQAIMIARLEHSDVRGLYVAYKDENENISLESLEQAFSERLHQTGISGNLVFDTGAIPETICDRAEVNDLVVLKLSHPPSPKFFPRFSSGMRIIIRRCSRPILAVNYQVSPMNNLLLAYDGSPKGREALFIAGYIASNYQKKLSVLVVEDDQKKGDNLIKQAQDYLGENCINVISEQQTSKTSDVILRIAAEINADMILMGGYGLSPILEALRGSTVDGVLRDSQVPVMICQ